MRRRIVALVLLTTLSAVLLFGALITVLLWRDALDGATQQAAATARVASSGLEDRVESGREISPAQVQSYIRDGEQMSVTVSGGTPVESGPLPTGEVVSATSTTGSVTVVATIPSSALLPRLAGLLALVAALGLLVLALAGAAAMAAARRLTRPLADFERQAERIATGDGRTLGRRYDVPELDAVAEVLDRSTTTFHEVLEAERQATNEASHQLRTPLTALSLRLEEILGSDDLNDIHAEATAALDQVERLSGVVTEVVSVRRGRGVARTGPVAVTEIVASQVREWQPAFGKAGRDLTAVGESDVIVDVARGAQEQVLATLIENSLRHGGGTTTVRIRPTGSWVVIEVGDQGDGVPEALEADVFTPRVSGGSSSGLGLALARTLMTADGGRLELLSPRPAVFAMFLPVSGGRQDAPTHDATASAGTSEPDGHTVVSSAARSAAAGSSGNTQRR